MIQEAGIGHDGDAPFGRAKVPQAVARCLREGVCPFPVRRPTRLLRQPLARDSWGGVAPSGGTLNFLLGHDASDTRPLKWSDSKYGFLPEEDCNAKEETQG